MARVKRSVHSRKGRRDIMERAQGFKASRSRRLRAAHEQVMNAMQDAYRDRRTRKGTSGACGLPASTPLPGRTAPPTPASWPT